MQVGTTEQAPETVREFCRAILARGELDAKLTPPGGRELPDVRRGAAESFERPARSTGLEMGGGAARLPRPAHLGSAEARALCIARFAHHELMAVELFAWALLRWPEAPLRLRAAWLGALAEEQEHCALYLERLDALGARFSDYPHSDYFWRQLPAIAASQAGPRAFLAGVGLTLEQANLDFTLIYRDAFRAAGDEGTAAVCQRVHDEEQGHVGLAYRWLLELDDADRDACAAYRAAVPFPLSASRAKGRRFDVASRRRAGLDPEFIAYVRDARSSQQSGEHPSPDAGSPR